MTHIARDDAITLLKKYNKDPFHIQHAFTMEAVIKFLGENPGACPWDEAKKYFSKSLMSISSDYTLQI